VAAYQQRFVLALSQAGSTYAVAEAASATPLQQIEQALLGVINTPTEALVGRKLIGDGAHGAPGTGQAGGAGGILWGNGGNGGSGAPGQAGAVTTITHASFNDPHGVAVNPGGNVYVTNF
ncbi:hypothetical protein DSK40_03965, partial [Mycobacterium tuberculosis]